MKDLSIAERTARSAGFSHIEAKADIRSAKLYLETVLDAEEPRPDVILLDLDLGQDSGYELLRTRYSTPPPESSFRGQPGMTSPLYRPSLMSWPSPSCATVAGAPFTARGFNLRSCSRAFPT